MLLSLSGRFACKGSVHASLLLLRPCEHPKLALANKRSKIGQGQFGRSRSNFYGGRLGHPKHRLAWRYRKYAPDIGTLAQLEAAARDGKLGRGVAAEPSPALGVAKDEGRSPARGAGREVHREPAKPGVSQAGLPVRGVTIATAVWLGDEVDGGRLGGGVTLRLSLRTLSYTPERWSQFWSKVDRWGFRSPPE